MMYSKYILVSDKIRIILLKYLNSNFRLLPTATSALCNAFEYVFML